MGTKKAQMVFYQARAWRFIKRQGRPVAASEVAEFLNISMGRTSNLLRRLKLRGLAEFTGSTYHARWTVKGAMPEAQWGLAKGTQEALKPNHKDWERLLKLAYAAKGLEVVPKVVKRPPVAKPGIALEQFWGVPRASV